LSKNYKFWHLQSSVPKNNFSWISHKNFDVDIVNSELIQAAFPDIENIETSEQVNNAYMQYQDSFIHILNKHAPVKTRRPRKNPLSCMNSELRERQVNLKGRELKISTSKFL
jgi:hypothetical protein